MPKKQKSGLYRAKIKIGVGEDGRAIYKYLSAKTKKELDGNLSAAKLPNNPKNIIAPAIP